MQADREHDRKTEPGYEVDGAIRYVLGLYALLIGIAFLGITKPF